MHVRRGAGASAPPAGATRHRPQHAWPSWYAPTRRGSALAALSASACAAIVAGLLVGGGDSAVAERVHQPANGLSPAALAAGQSGAVDSGTSDSPASMVAFPATSGPVSTTVVASGVVFDDFTGPPNSTPASGLAASGIPSTALAAYQQAAAREKSVNPRCRLEWPLLAAIGRVESNHGRFAGATLHSDGLSTPRVVGIPLDGNGTAVIRDTDGGRLDGDRTYDRAVGPMQFIPSTWASWGVDANHDGTRDVFNIFDAAAAAADYLCAAGRDLSTLRGQVQGILSYNHSDAYVSLVLGVERIYASPGRIKVPVLPTSPDPHTTPPSPPALPPVDPGRPRGLSDPPPCSAAAGHRTSPSPSAGSCSGSPSRPSTSSATPTGTSPTKTSPTSGSAPGSPSTSAGSSSTSPGPSSTSNPPGSGSTSATETISPTDTSSSSDSPQAASAAAAGTAADSGSSP